MITIEFVTKNSRPFSVEVSGHALFDNSGRDIVCAGVTSSLMMFANGVTEILKQPAEVVVSENNVKVTLPNNTNDTAVKFLESFLLHVENLREDYPKNIKIKISEV